MWTCHVSYSCDEQRAELKNIFLNNYARRIFIRNVLNRKYPLTPYRLNHH